MSGSYREIMDRNARLLAELQYRLWQHRHTTDQLRAASLELSEMLGNQKSDRLAAAESASKLEVRANEARVNQPPLSRNVVN